MRRSPLVFFVRLSGLVDRRRLVPETGEVILEEP